MKTVGVVMSVVATLAGVVVARLEYEREAPDEPAELPASRGAAGDQATGGLPVGADGRTGPSDPTRGGDRDSPRGEGTRPEERDILEAGDAGTHKAPSGELRERLERLEDLVAKQRFKKAGEEAKDLLGALEEEGVRPTADIVTATRRLAARARVFQRLLDNIEPMEKSLVKEVLLANGNTIQVVRAAREGDRYVLELPNGISYRPRLDEVREVRDMSKDQVQRFVAGEWRRLQRRLEKVEDPLTLYVRGVQRCYWWGLVEEGFTLLERVLALPGSDVIPRRFAGGDPEAAAHDWEVAAGRLDEIVEATETASRVPPSSARTGSDHDPDSTGVRTSPSELLERVKALRDEARQLYRSGVNLQGSARSDRDLREARERLERAFSLIETLTAGEEVDALRRDLGQILSDVVRVSPF